MSLLNICAQQTKELVRNGRLDKDSDDVVNPVVSPLIAEKEKQVLSGAELRTMVTNGQKLENVMKIVIEDVTREDLQFIKNKLHGRRGPKQIEIVDVLEHIVKPSHRYTIRSLRLSNIKGCLLDCHILKIARLFPLLTVFEFEEVTLSPSAVSQVFKSLPELNSLCMSNTRGMNLNLKGISNLQKLIVLVLHLIELSSSQEAEELFGLKNLQVLNIVEISDETQNVPHFLSCRKSLPELRFIDLSLSAINENQLKELIKLHPKLQGMSLIGTPLGSHPPPETGRVSLLTMHNLEACLKSFSHYDQSGAFNDYMNEKILMRMTTLVSNKYEEQTTDLLRKSSEAIIAIESPYLHYRAGSFLIVLIQSGNRIELFNESEIKVFIKKLLYDWFNIWEVEQNDYPNRELLHHHIWNFVASPGIVPMYTDLLVPIVHRSVWIIKQSKNRVIENYDAIAGCLYAFGTCLKAHANDDNPAPALNVLHNDKELCDTAMQLTNSLDFDNERVSYICRLLTDIVEVLYFKLNPQYVGVTEATGITSKMAKVIEQGTEMNRNRCLLAIYLYLYEFEMDYRLFFEEPVFSILTRAFYTREGDLKLNVQVLVAVQILKSGGDRDELYIAVERWETRVSDILNDINTFESDGAPTDKLAIFKWMLENGGRGSIPFAEFILSHFGNVEAPRAKRRRTAK